MSPNEETTMPTPMPVTAMQIASSASEPWNAITSSRPRASSTQPKVRNGPLPAFRDRYPTSGPMITVAHSAGTMTQAPATGPAPRPFSPGTGGICANVEVATSAPNSPNPARMDTALFTHIGRDQNTVWSTSGFLTLLSTITHATAVTTAITIRKITCQEVQPQAGCMLNAMSRAIAGIAKPAAPDRSTACHHFSGAPGAGPRPFGTNSAIPARPS